MKVIGNLNIENKLHVGNLNVPTFNMEVDGGDNEIHAKFYGNYGGNQGILVERSGGDNVKLLAGYTGYGGGLESKSALRFAVGGNNLSTPAVQITEAGVVNVSEYIKFPYVNSTNTPTPNIPNVATQKRAIWMDMEGDESYLEYGHVDAGHTYTQFRVTDNNSGDRFRIYIDDWEKVEKDRIPLDVRGDRVLLCQDGGNVGIGLTDPENKLSVKRTLGIMNPDWDNGAAVGSRLLIGLNSTSGDDFSFIQAQDAGGTSNNNLILQRYGGRVGIGTTSPGTNLHILAGEGSDAVIRIEADPDNTTGTETDNPRVEFVQDGGNIESAIGHNLISSGDQNVLQIANSVGTGGGILFATDTQNTGYSNADPRMLITGDGDVGIGTTSPDSKLHVDGQVKIVDGSEGVDKVLTSDASGLASWEDLSSMVGGLVSDTNTHVVSGVITTTLQDPAFTKGPYVTHLILTKNDGTEVSIDITDLKDDWQTHNLLFNSNTNILTLYSYNPNDGTGAPRKENSVDLSSLVAGLAADTNNYVTTGKLVGNILTLERNGGLSDITVDMSQFIDNVDTNTYVIGGSVVKGAVACDHKIRLELNNGSFIAGAIDVSSLSSDNYVSDLTLVGSQLTLKQSNDCGNEKPTFQVDLSPLTSGLSSGGDNDWTVSGNNMYSTPSGYVGIGTNTPVDKLHVKDGDIFVDGDSRSVWIGGNGDNDNPRLRLHSAPTGAYIDWEGSPSGGLHFRSDTTTKVIITKGGDVGIGTSSPDSKLHIEGQIKITGGNPGPDKVLTSDANGLATWKNHSGASNVGFFEIGMILPFAGNVLPVGWIECNGQVWWQDEYPKLYGVIGDSYNKGKSYPNRFLVPDLRGRSIVGYDQTGSFQDVNGTTIFDDIGDRGGSIVETLTHTQIPYKSHTHTINESGSGHYHPISWVHSGTGNQTGNNTGERAANVLNGHHLKHVDIELEWTRTGDHTFNGTNATPNGAHAGTNLPHTPKQDLTQGEHSHSMSTGSASNNSNGGPHNNLSPYLTMKYMIYAGPHTPHADSDGNGSE